jgi:hypothetical protein
MTVTVLISTHAIERYQARVRPGLTFEQAEADLQRLLALGTLTRIPPEWLAARQRDLVFPLDPARSDQTAMCALTCLARGGISTAARARRTITKKHGRSGRITRSRA